MFPKRFRTAALAGFLFGLSLGLLLLGGAARSQAAAPVKPVPVKAPAPVTTVQAGVDVDKIALMPRSDDAADNVTLQTQAALTVHQALVQLKFSKPYPAAPQAVFLQPTSIFAVDAELYPDQVTASGFVVRCTNWPWADRPITFSYEVKL